MKYATWKKVSGLGHDTILVYTEDNGSLHRDVKVVQCSTVDRIPFTMKRKDLEERYAPEEAK